MCIKSVILLGLITLVALSGAKLRWKCELLDTSQESSSISPRTTFVEFVKNKPPEPNVPNTPNNPRTPRSTPKCRPRPRNGTAGPSIQTEKLKVRKNKEIVQQDPFGILSSGDIDAPQVKYQRKESHQSLDLNIGPGFEESNDPYGRNKQPVPKRFRPAELKGADELDKPLTEHLDENVMPDFEFDEDDAPPVQDDLPWCPEEDETECETKDLEKLSVKELVEFKDLCEKSVNSERKALIEKLIRIEGNPDRTLSPDRTSIAPPTGFTNCSTSPSELSNATRAKYQKECPCEEDTSNMSTEEFEKFKKECLDVIEIPGKPYQLIRKNGRCGISQQKTDAMSETEYALFVKECLVGPKKIVLKKILIINGDGEGCKNVDTKKMNKVQFSKYQKKCTVSKNCDDIDKTSFSKKELSRFNKMCSSVTRKTKNICDEDNVENLDNEQFESYREECILNGGTDDCDDISVNSLSDSEYEEYKKKCGKPTMNCENINPDNLSKKERSVYEKECLHPSPQSPPHVYPPNFCKTANAEKLNDKDYAEYKRQCTEIPPMDCHSVSPDELSDTEYQRYKEECRTAEDCAKINPKDLTGEEYAKYERNCLNKKINCSTVDPRELTQKQYRRFEKVCLKDTKDCRNVNVKDQNDKEHEKFRSECLKSIDCSSMGNVDELTDEEYKVYQRECLNRPGNDFDCPNTDPRTLSRKLYLIFEEKCLSPSPDCKDRITNDMSYDEYAKFSEECLVENFDCETVEPKNLSEKLMKKYQKECVRSTPDCRDMKVDEVAIEKYKEYERKCIWTKLDCSYIKPDELSKKEYKKYKRYCLDKVVNCSTADARKLTQKQYRRFEKVCLKDTQDCRNVNMKDHSDEDYEKFRSDCVRREFNCDSVGNVDQLSEDEYNDYKKRCKVNFEGDDCDEIRVDKLSDHKLQEYVNKCGLFCGIERKNVLTKKQQKVYEKRCEGDTNELDKDCKDIVVEKLGERMYGDFAEKCLEPINACSMLKTRRLVRKVYNEYRLKCKPRLRPSTEFKCEEADTENMTLEEFKNYELKCGKVSDNCDNVNVNELSEQEYLQYKRRCRIDYTHKSCKDIVLNELSREEYKKYLKKCGRRRPKESNASDTDCDSKDLVEMSRKEFLKHITLCGNPVDTTLPNCKNIDVEVLSNSEYEEYKKNCLSSVIPSKERQEPGGGAPMNCSTVNVDKLSDKEYKEYKKKCGKKIRSEVCDDVNVDSLSVEQYNEYLRNCEKKPRRKTPECSIKDTSKLSDEEYKIYKKKCGSTSEDGNAPPNGDRQKPSVTIEKTVIINPTGPKNPDDCGSINPSKLSDSEYEEYKKKCGKERKTPKPDCDDVDTNNLSDEEYRMYKKRCQVKKTPKDNCSNVNVKDLTEDEYSDFKKRCGSTDEKDPGESVSITKTVVINKPPKDGNEPNVEKTVIVKNTPGPDDPEKSDYCASVNPSELSESEYKEYKKKCESVLERKTPKLDCDDVDTNKLSNEEYRMYKKKCGKERHTPKPDCDSVDVTKLSGEEYRDYKNNCGTPKRPEKPNREDCYTVKIEELTAEEYVAFKKRCLSAPETPGNRESNPEEPTVVIKKELIENNPPGPEEPRNPDNCSSVNVAKLTLAEYKEYKRKCARPDCDDVDTNKMSEEEYRAYKKRCGKERKTPKPDCDEVDVNKLSDEEYRLYKKRCMSTYTPEDDCSNIRVKDLTEKEYADFKRRCGNTKVPEESVTIKKTVVINKPPKDGSTPSGGETGRPPVTIEKTIRVEKPGNSDYCSSINTSKLSKSEYKEYKRRCESQPERHDCDDVDTNKLSEEEYRAYKKRCGKRRPVIEDCSNINIAKLSDTEYNEYRRKCRPTRKTTSPDCADIDETKLSGEELEKYNEKCTFQEDPPPSETEEMKCKDINVEEMDAEEFVAYKKRCGTPKRPENPRERPPGSSPSENCRDVKVEELTADEYAEYKKKCLRNPRKSTNPPDENCSKVNIDELTDKEYRSYIRRCPNNPTGVKITKTVEVGDGCQNKNTDDMTKEEYQQFRQECSRKPHVELTKIIKIVEPPTKPGDSPDEFDWCSGQDINKMPDAEYEKFKEKCLGFRKTFQFNCNLDVSNMSDEEFKKFRKACSKKPFNCETVDVDTLSDKEYSRFQKECRQRPEFECKDAKVERMNAQEYEEYRKKCKKTTTKVTKVIDSCDDVKVEELSRIEYAKYKSRCVKETTPSDTPPTKIRKRIDCSIVDESMMSEEEYSDFKKHCNVKVTTDRYRPGENIILTKKVKIRTGKEKFSCYDQDVDRMTDEEYSEFEKKCLTHPLFRYDCSTVDTTNLSRDEYSKYQRECQKPDASVVLVKKLVINKENVPVKDGCYNRDVDGMSDDEYSEYEVRCLGHPSTPKPVERKTSIDCHNVDMSKLSYTEIEEYLKRCRTRETASTQPPPPRRQSLKCSGINTDDLNEDDYAKWVKECLQEPKTIKLEKKIIINPTIPPTPRGERVLVEKLEIHEHLRPDDDEGLLEGNEDFGVRITTGIRKRVIKGSPGDDSESEGGVILVKKVIHRIPTRRRPSNIPDEEDEGGVIEVRKMIMKTREPEPDVDDSEDVEEIMRRPRKRIGPKEEVVLLSVTKKHPHSYRTKTVPDEEPVEIVKLVKNRRLPNATLREVRIRKHFGTGIPGEEAVVQEIGGPDFKITRKTVMVPRKVRKMKSTTTTTTTPAEPEYYYDEEEYPEVITLVKVEKSRRPLRKYSRPDDEDDEFVDVRENKPKSYIEFEGFVKVRGNPRKIRKRPSFTDSGEEPDIREVTRKIVEGEEDDFKGVRLKSHRKKLVIVRRMQEEEPEEEHEVRVVKKLKVMKFGNEEKENFDNEENVEDDGKIIVRNRKRQYFERNDRPDDEEEGEELVNRRVAVRGRAPKIFRWAHKPGRKSAKPSITERNSEFYKIGGSHEEENHRKEKNQKKWKNREDTFRRRRKPEYEEESEELGRRKPRFGEESEEFERKGSRPDREQPNGETTVIKKVSGGSISDPTPRLPDDQGESVAITKKKIFKYGEKRDTPDDEDENEEIKLLKRKQLYLGARDKPTGENDGNGEIVKITKKKSFKIGPNGQKIPYDGNEDEPQFRRKTSDHPGKDQDEDVQLFKKKNFYRIVNGKRVLIRTEEDIPEQDEDGESVKITKKKFYRIGQNGEKIYEDEDESRRSRKISKDEPGEDQDEQIKLFKRKKFYKIVDGKRVLIKTEGDVPGQGENGEQIKITKKRTYRIGPNGEKIEKSSDDQALPSHDRDGKLVIGKNNRLYRKGSEIPDEDENGESVKVMKRKEYQIEKPQSMPEESEDEEFKLLTKKKKMGVIANDPSNDGSEIIKMSKKKAYLTGEGSMSHDQDGEGSEEIMMKKRKRFYKVGADGKRELLREEEIPMGQLGTKKSSYSPEPLDGERIEKTKRIYKLGRDGKQELQKMGDDESGDDSQDGTHVVKMMKRKKTYRYDANGEKELIKEENVPGDLSSDGEGDGKMIWSKKTRRSYTIDKDGNRKLVKEEKVPGGPMEDDGQKLMGTKKTKRFYKMVDGKRKLMKTETSDGDNMMMPKHNSTPENDGVPPPDDNNKDHGDSRERSGSDEETRTRNKGTNKRRDGRNDGRNMNLGSIIKPRRRSSNDGNDNSDRNDGRREKTRSSRRARSSRKMEKYHKDRNVRSSGKSEELVPE